MHFIFIGPNYAWHCDGYDKLKPYGLPIHGCIDGYIINIAKLNIFISSRFSRRIMWLKVAASNNNPRFIVAHYFECIKHIGGKKIDSKLLPINRNI